ncbi:chondroitinase family polysaccharide lyase [Psychromonas ossibalaenae]|uniref:chondroitinase family polysaccharide lyase n=1 Tax=Psychromonas ossibalaenae TaxID=444922 RepID=UPI000381EC76|nr:chondroitinase family polysaccharide lyase [Psychromonas ossibalaenae]
MFLLFNRYSSSIYYSALFILLFSFSSLSSAACTEPLQAQILSFEEAELPEWIESDSASLTDKRSILGKQSLLWQWRQGDDITFNHTFCRIDDEQATAAYGRGATQVLSFWIYNPKAVPDTLTVQLSDAQSSPGSITEFPVGLNFVGWRAVGLSLNLDFTPEVTYQFDKIRFISPAEKSGQLYIDRIMVSVDDNRYQWSDDQVSTRIILPEIDFGLDENLPEATQEELNDAEQIKQTMIDELSGYNGSMQDLEDKFALFNIEKDSGGDISGRHIITDKQQVIYQPDNLSPADKTDFDEYAVLGDSDSKGEKITGYAQLMLDISKAYHEPDFAAERPRLSEMYIQLTVHLLDQGYVDGSSLVTTHHWGYSGRWWYNSALMMEPVLTRAGLLQPTYNALLWFSREFKESFDMELIPESSNLDYFNTLAFQHLALLIINPDDNERIALLHKFSEFFSGALAQTPPGTHDGFRPDGTAWRHNGHYPAYAFPAFKNAAVVVSMLKNSLFSITEEGADKLKLVMMAGWHYSNPVVPLGLSGRHPFTTLELKGYADGMEKLANSYPQVDEELAAVYLQVTDTSYEESEAIFGKRIHPAPLPEGSWSFNGGAFAVHRSGERMALIKGYNKDVWSSEIYTNDNRYGRYQSHGGVSVIPYGDPSLLGFQEDGWDWNRNPGTTTIHLDYDLLESPKTSTLMVRSEYGTSGSTSLKEQFSIFSFKHIAPDNLENFEPTFRAQKFVLAGEDKLYLTGSAINNADGINNTETTLFQLAYGEESQGIWINGSYHDQGGFTHQLTSGDWLIDDNGVGYYLIDAEKVNVRRGEQDSRHNKTKEPTSGTFTTAWIDHGTAPENAGYQYVMLMESTPVQMAHFAYLMQNDSQFLVLEQTEQGELLFDKRNSVYGYSSFESSVYEQGPLRSISTTAQVLAQTYDNHMDLSIASTELNIQENDLPTTAVSITVEIEGIWEIQNSAAFNFSHRSGNTFIEVDSFFGQSVSLRLCRDLSVCKNK